MSQEDSIEQTESESEKTDPTELSIGSIVAWLFGGLTILSGVANIFQGTIIAAIILFVAGIFGLPPTRSMIEDELNIIVSRWLAVLIYLILVFAAGGVAASM